MTCIVGIETKDAVYIGADSMGSNGFTGQAYERPKVFVKDSLLIACCGSFRIMQIIEFALKVPRQFTDQSDEEYAHLVFPNAVKEVLNQNGAVETKDGVARMCSGSEALFAFKAKLYIMHGNFSVLRTKSGYNASGSGLYHATASLFSTQDLELSPEERIRRAIICASNYVVTVDDSITILKQAAA